MTFRAPEVGKTIHEHIILLGTMFLDRLAEALGTEVGQSWGEKGSRDGISSGGL